jgi:hypothetical protein
MLNIFHFFIIEFVDLVILLYSYIIYALLNRFCFEYKKKKPRALTKRQTKYKNTVINNDYKRMKKYV